MAEKFKSYNKEIPVKSNRTSNPTEETIIDKSNTPERPDGYVAQVHSIYISQVSNDKFEGLERYNPKNFSAFNLYIDEGEQSNNKIYIVYDGRIVPGSPFFIEKNITLESNQRLVIECPTDSRDINTDTNQIVSLNTDTNVKLHISASAVLFPTAS